MTRVDAIRLSDIRDLLDCEVVAAPGVLDAIEVTTACGADLMSDVLAFAKSGAVLLTGLTNAQTVRTAQVADLKAVVYVRNKQPDADAVEAACEFGMPLLRTARPMYEACGVLFGAGVPGCSGESAGRYVKHDGQAGV